MNLQQFQTALQAKHPQAQAARTREVGGATVANGLTITFTPGGQMYHYQGGFHAIAQQLGLIEKWYILESGSVVDQATSEAEALHKMQLKRTLAQNLAFAWGGSVGEFTIRKVN